MWGPTVSQLFSVHPHARGAGPLGPPCSTSSAELDVPIRANGAPDELTESLNCRWMESFPVELPSARMRTQTW